MRRFFQQLWSASFKRRIIITFSLLTALLVILLARVSYMSVREIYLDQVVDQTNLLTRQLARDLNVKFLHLLVPGKATGLTADFYNGVLNEHTISLQIPSAFIFDRELRILARSDADIAVAESDPQLLIHRAEINAIDPGISIASLPFRGTDGHWYLWGFYRLSDTHWLGVQQSARRLERVESLGNIFWIIGSGGLLLTIVAGWLLARTLTRPVDRLIDFSRQLGREEFEAPLPAGIDGELATLAAALDRMRHNLRDQHREREQMLAQIAHEIRNPLGGMELLAGLVREDLNKHNISDEYIDRILKEIRVLKSSITAYLSYSRPAAAAPEWIGVDELFEEVRLFCAEKADAKRIAISSGVDTHQVFFDRAHLKQVLINLVSNSVQAAPDGGSIFLGARNGGQETIIMVSDDGPGIPAENLENIFEPFYTTRVDGTGLGLAVCRKLCRENNAELLAVNNDIKGCTFRIITHPSAAPAAHNTVNKP